jgi:RNA polymerase primary sigma factor
MSACLSVRSAIRLTRAGNGTRTRDPNLGKVVLYQLSYSRRRMRILASAQHPRNHRGTESRAAGAEANGGEGDRTPDLVNAIHALSQLSYAPVSFLALAPAHRQHGSIAAASESVKPMRRQKFMRRRSRPRDIFQRMRKKKNDHKDPSPRPSQRPADTSPVALSADLTVAEILAQSPPVKPRRTKKKDTSGNLGVYDADKDILDQYLHEVSKTPLLTAQQEVAIARKVRAGDEEAMQELVKRNLRFVISVAKKYQNRGLALTDLIGEGNVGLLTAARKFDPDQGVKFISYAVWWIRQSILAALARHGRTVRVPLNRTADLSRIVRTSETLRQELRREPTPEEIADVTGLALDVVQSLAALNTTEVRLDAPLDPEGDRALIDRFIAEEQGDPEERAMETFLSEEIEHALRSLPPRDAKVLRLYFGLDGGREHTLEEIGGMLGVTRERVRQLRDRALKRLREGDVGRALASFAA